MNHRGHLIAVPCLAICVMPIIGCEQIDVERMIEQPSYRAYEASEHFEDGMVMRRPPAGTISRDRLLGPTVLTQGLLEGDYVDQIPIAVTEALLSRGADQYRVFCAPCHGHTGNGVTQVSENMSLRPPPVIVTPPVSEYPPGRVYRTVQNGFGLMPAYDTALSVPDRWAVVAYVEALALSQRVELTELPPEVQEEARSWLR
jgi:mono/diheme cytochrome c family protein